MVVDAGAKYNSVCLNDELLEGPDLLLLSVEELTRAELLTVKRTQMESFLDDCEALLKNLPQPPKK